MDVVVYADTDQLSQAAAQYMIRVAREALSSRGRFTCALSGGSTPKKLFALLAADPFRQQIDWSRVEVFWADERCVPADDAESSYHMTEQTLLSKVPLPASQIHRMPAEEPDRAAAAQKYSAEMRRVFATDGVPRFDLIQLGMGPEGHTASLFPHQDSLQELSRLVMPVTVPKPPPPRLTLTPPVLNAAQHVLFLVAGSDKAAALQAVLEGPYQPAEYPAQLVRPSAGEVTWLLDTAAASKLEQHAQER